MSALSSTMASSVSDAEALDTMALALVALDVTACDAMDCGSGVCHVGPDGPACNCEGTRATGAHCDVPITAHGDQGSPSPSPSATGGAAPALHQPSATAAPIQRPCPGDNAASGVECSGHGVCTRSYAQCTVLDVQCIVACRYGGGPQPRRALGSGCGAAWQESFTCQLCVPKYWEGG
jgi:hypothetical protein